MALFLAIDAGGTKTKAVISTVVDGQPRIVAEGLAPGANLAEVGLATCSSRLQLASLNAITKLPAAAFAASAASEGPAREGGPCPVRFASVWIGISGVDNPPDIRRLTPPLEEFFGTSVMVQNDALLLASPLIESGARSGILAVGGTGSVCLAVNLDGAGQVEFVGRRGGLGFMLGDEGSAYHVGRTVLRLVLYAADAGTLDESSPFISALLAYWKVEQIDQLLEKTYSVDPALDARDAENDRKLRISESCRLIVSHAFPPPGSTFDAAPLALEAVQHSTQELAKDIAALVATGRTKMDSSASMLSLGGSLVGQPAYRALLVESLRRDYGLTFGKGVVHVQDAAADGALALAKLSLAP